MLFGYCCDTSSSSGVLPSNDSDRSGVLPSTPALNRFSWVFHKTCLQQHLRMVLCVHECPLTSAGMCRSTCMYVQHFLSCICGLCISKTTLGRSAGCIVRACVWERNCMFLLLCFSLVKPEWGVCSLSSDITDFLLRLSQTSNGNDPWSAWNSDPSGGSNNNWASNPEGTQTGMGAGDPWGAVSQGHPQAYQGPGL